MLRMPSVGGVLRTFFLSMLTTVSQTSREIMGSWVPSTRIHSSSGLLMSFLDL